MNRAILIGNLANDPEVTTLSSGVTKCSFRLAVQRRFANPQTGQREADFIPIVAWRQTGELCAKYLSKGRKCAICGMMQTRSYDAQDGSKRYVTEVVADEVQFLGGGASQQMQGMPPEARNDQFTPVDDDELPF